MYILKTYLEFVNLMLLMGLFFLWFFCQLSIYIRKGGREVVFITQVLEASIEINDI
jgi:hypothetical protein